MVKIELGIEVPDGSTGWPVEYRTWATNENISKAVRYLIHIAERAGESITGFRLTKEVTS